ncbi:MULTISPECIES: CHAP domain-containing protein [unclassified Saccharibacter]|uniref:CHAP domain-containing protein n=1 Tax=unclassified Saccharibacter TaxID=2648722 RepID=UPI001325E8C7|nr:MULTISPECIES: CHAP domain-containing protein [unclassified Saccharibacter]MXV36347.1 CHAP domain-containing protein [Saccharibacter sp. EH611]MXV57509.1 CHAP domain-containing protein [Saccharibacter sp. EH70]MXV65184.1 CHAP domain-containing protein [Saccharibacter sp. EH60]
MLRRGKRLIFSSLTLSALVLCVPQAHARHSQVFHHRHTLHHTRSYRHVLQCVGFVHQATDFHIRGNARDWWQRAAGLYARGNTPASGAVLSFLPRRHMRLGHVAVVRSQVDSRTILIDQSHWGHNGIDRNVRVVDVSPNNDWTAVRVALRGHQDSFGSIYKTHGFIYNRPEGKAPAQGNMQDVLASNNDGLQTASLPDNAPTQEVFVDDAPNRSIR